MFEDIQIKSIYFDDYQIFDNNKIKGNVTKYKGYLGSLIIKIIFDLLSKSLSHRSKVINNNFLFYNFHLYFDAVRNFVVDNITTYSLTILLMGLICIGLAYFIIKQ